MIVVTQNDINSEIEKGLAVPNRFVLIDYVDKQVNYGRGEKPNFEYCATHNIPCVDIGRRGGAFAINKGDVGFGCAVPNLNNTIGIQITTALFEFLKSKGLDVSINENDVLVDGYKTYGWMSNYYKEHNALVIMCHFSMSVDLDMIKGVCTKPMNKTPKGLSEFGIHREEIIELIETTVAKYVRLNNIET